ncbi:hypothetical protein F4859DRAFT_488726 [Xylaria cf. heliscus]|nr:hypothetical protein F4859DRAFT_488726 [Xylaria cf. heliscus]
MLSRRLFHSILLSYHVVAWLPDCVPVTPLADSNLGSLSTSTVCRIMLWGYMALLAAYSFVYQLHVRPCILSLQKEASPKVMRILGVSQGV